MNVYDKTFLPVLQNFIEIFILWCHESFESCKSSSTLNFCSSRCSFKIIFRTFLICFDQTIVNIKENFCVWFINLSLRACCSQIIVLTEKHIFHVILRQIRQEISSSESKICVFFDVFHSEMESTVLVIYIVELEHSSFGVRNFRKWFVRICSN